MPFLTPSDIPTETICRTIRIPNSKEWLSIYNGVISELLGAFEWEQDDPTHITPLQARDTAQQIFFDYTGSDCMIGAIIASICNLQAPRYLPMDGATHNRADYPELYRLLKDEFSLLVDTFYLPDLSRQVLAQYDPTYEGMGGDLHTWSNLHTYIGEQDHLLSIPELPIHQHGMIHTHSLPDHAHTTDIHTHSGVFAGPNLTTIGPGAPQPTAVPVPGISGPGGGGLTSFWGNPDTQGQTPELTEDFDGVVQVVHNTVQPTFLLRYFIVAK